MDVIKCSLPQLVINFIDHIGPDSQELESVIIQNYINSLNCNTKEIICVSKYDTICEDTVNNLCKLFINSLTIESTPTGIKITPVIFNSFGTITYNWTFDPTKFTLPSGKTVTDPVLFLDWINGNIVTDFEVSLKIVDAKGCNYEIDKEISYCEPCLEPTLSMDYGPCWSYIGNDDYLLKITPEFSCTGLPNYNDYLTNIYVSSPDISIVKDTNNDWNLKVKDINAFKALNCGNDGRIYFGKSFAREIYEYNVNTGDATFKLTFPPSVVYNHPTLGSITVPLNTGDGDIAVTANKIFFLNWFTAPDPTGTFPIDYSFVGRYDIDWNTLVLSNFTMIAEPSGADYEDGFYVSLEAVSDNLVLVDWVQGMQPGGFLPATEYEIREYNFSTLTYTIFSDITALYGVDSCVNDIAFDGTHVYMLQGNFTSTPVFIIRKFNYITKALVASSSPLSFSINAVSPPGIAVLDGKIYVAEDFGNVLVYDATTFNYLYNRDITNINIRGTVPPAAPLDAISGMGQIPPSPSENLQINYTVDYNECGEIKTITLTEDFPCDIPVCCEDCELDLNITFADCYIPYSDEGIVGGAVEVTITSNGCVNVNDIDFEGAVVTDNTLGTSNILKFVKIDNKWHILSSESSWPAGMISVIFGYTVCGVSKNYSGTFGKNDIIECCADCPEENAFTVTIADCYEILEGITILADYTINCPGWTNTIGVVASVIKNGVQIGTITTYGAGYRIEFSTNDISEICGIELQLTSNIDDCNGDPTLFYSTLTIPCDIAECGPCVDCDNPNEANYNININDLCWSETNPSLSKYEAVIPNVFTCAGKILKVSSITVLLSTGCTYTTVVRDGIWYLTVDKTCADINPNSTINLRICWNDCD